MKQKKLLINRLVSELKSKDYNDINKKTKDSSTTNAFSPNVLAYKNGQLHLFDVKVQLTDKIDFLIKKWRYLSDIAKETGAVFKIIVPRGKEQIAHFIAKHNKISAPIVPI